MINTIINCIVTFIVTSIMTISINKLKEIKKTETRFMKEFKDIKESQLMDMKSDLSNKFFVYNAMDEVEDYLVIGFQEKCERYFSLGGNTYVHQLYDKSKTWTIKPTGYLN